MRPAMSLRSIQVSMPGMQWAGASQLRAKMTEKGPRVPLAKMRRMRELKTG